MKIPTAAVGVSGRCVESEGEFVAYYLEQGFTGTRADGGLSGVLDDGRVRSVSPPRPLASRSSLCGPAWFAEAKTKLATLFNR